MLTIRARRNRKTASIRQLIEETTLHISDLVMPCFIIEGEKKEQEIPHIPGNFLMTVDVLLKRAAYYHKLGVMALALFPVIEASLKDLEGSYALSPHNVILKAVELLKKELPSLCIITDIALDPFTSHGHDGVINQDGYVLNDPTVAILCKMAYRYASSGSDIVAPSDMMDGRILSIRKTLDQNGLIDTSILAYSAKYSSSLYAPFRDTVGSKLTQGDKKSYQLSPANAREALRQARLDIEEGADMVMIKPATSYLDIIYRLRQEVLLPICSYHVSGEYAAVMAGAKEGLLDASSVLYEQLLCIKRAGSDFIFTYAVDHILALKMHKVCF
ncbi:porphobilinogen synthase [Rhabdochlamydiaceae symbiont of Dictyostelium giganteum]|uniref:porphobilinogen synthase n=1 Tax=Rhabdochlamydiaceae symbiont of Dictyostelium giganteum TaxID=3342349 RepID=UPI00384DCCC7